MVLQWKPMVAKALPLTLYLQHQQTQRCHRQVLRCEGRQDSRLCERYHRGQLGAHAIGPDQRGLLELAGAQQAAGHRSQLRARCEADEAVPYEALQCCRVLCYCLLERWPA